MSYRKEDYSNLEADLKRFKELIQPRSSGVPDKYVTIFNQIMEEYFPPREYSARPRKRVL